MTLTRDKAEMSLMPAELMKKHYDIPDELLTEKDLRLLERFRKLKE